MPKKAPNTKTPAANGANVGYEAKLWQMADALRGSMDAAEYKHVVLGRKYRMTPSGTVQNPLVRGVSAAADRKFVR